MAQHDIEEQPGGDFHVSGDKRFTHNRYMELVNPHWRDENGLVLACAEGWVCFAHTDKPFGHDGCAGSKLRCVDVHDSCPWWPPLQDSCAQCGGLGWHLDGSRQDADVAYLVECSAPNCAKSGRSIHVLIRKDDMQDTDSLFEGDEWRVGLQGDTEGRRLRRDR